MEKDISRTLLLGPLSDSWWWPWPVQMACWSEPTLYPTLPTLPNMGGPRPGGIKLNPEALRGHLWARGHTGCPVIWLSPGQLPAASSACSRSRSVCMSQERSQVPGPPVGPPGITVAAGLWPPGVVPGLQCPVCGVHRSLQGGPLNPRSSSSSGAPLWTQSWSDGFSSLPTQLHGDGSYSLGVEEPSCLCHVFSGDGTP